MSKNIFFHVGYPKCASSFLQKCLFNRHREVLYLGRYPTQNVGQSRLHLDAKNIYLQDERLRTFYKTIERPNSIDYDIETTQKLLEDVYAQQTLGSEKAIVFSSEAITSVFLGNRDLGVKANRIKQVLPDAKILFVVRKQSEIIKSQYRDWPFDPRSFEIGKPVSIDKWIDIIFDCNEQKGYLYYLSSLNFYRVVRYYENLFSKENILVLPFEEIKTNLPSLSQKIADFLNIESSETFANLSEAPENTGAPKALNTARRLRRLFPDEVTRLLPKEVKHSIMKALKKGKKEQIVISPESEAKLAHYFRDANRKLSAEYNLDLDQHGYF